MVMLPEVVAFCIRDALQTNLNLSWMIQHSNRGTTVVLYWRDRAKWAFRTKVYDRPCLLLPVITKAMLKGKRSLRLR
uniref:Uncharacterized protein n=1 Tax=Amphimedon queenslandica TaxID=400682 RepID=A0A1X7SNU6_AMPQE